MRTLFIILLFPALALGHVTENEMKIIERMRAAAAEQAVILEKHQQDADKATQRALQAVEGLANVEKLHQTTAKALKELEGATQEMAKERDAANERASQERERATKEIAKAQQETADERVKTKEAESALWKTRLTLGGAAGFFGLACLALVYLLFKP